MIEIISSYLSDIGTSTRWLRVVSCGVASSSRSCSSIDQLSFGRYIGEFQVVRSHQNGSAASFRRDVRKVDGGELRDDGERRQKPRVQTTAGQTEPECAGREAGRDRAVGQRPQVSRTIPPSGNMRMSFAFASCLKGIGYHEG